MLDWGPCFRELQSMLGYIRKEMRDPDVKRRGFARLADMTGAQIAKLRREAVKVLDAVASPLAGCN